MRLGAWLVRNHKITDEQLSQALRDQAFFGGRLGASLVRLGFIEEETLGAYLADVTGTRYAPPERMEEIPPEAIAAIPARLALQYRIIPLAIEGRRLHLAMRDPKDLIALDEIAFLTGLSIEPYIATEFRIVEALKRYYDVSVGTRTIPVSDQRTEPGRPPFPAVGGDDRSWPHGQLGLDGLPLDAEPEGNVQPFRSRGRGNQKTTTGPQAEIPTSLEEWRMAEQRSSETSPGPAAPPPDLPPDRSTRPSAAARRPATAPRPAHSMESFASRLRSAETRDEVFDAILDFTCVRFRRCALFIAQRDRVIGWNGRGDGIDPERIRNVTVPLDQPSLFVFFREGGDYYYGPVPDLPANIRFYQDLGCPAPNRVLLIPLTIKNRAAVILYADNGGDVGRAPEIDLFRRALRKTALALEILILKNKIMMD